MSLKLYKTEKTARTALRNQGLHLMNYSVKYMDAADAGYYVTIDVDNIDDFNEITDRGFRAVLVKTGDDNA